MIKKTIEPTGDLCIKFTDEEMSSLGIKAGDKFSFHYEDDGAVLLKKFTSIDIDLSEFSRENLELLIQLSAEQDISINDVISNLLEELIENFKND